MPEGLRAFRPARWPVRWRIAGVSAGLTLVILLVFAIVVGRLASDRLTEDFNHQVSSAATEIAVGATLAHDLIAGTVTLRSPNLDQIPVSSDVAIRVVDLRGNVIARTVGTPDFGQPQQGVVEMGAYRVVSIPILSTINTPYPAYVQYGRVSNSLSSTINRLWLLLSVGVLVGTALALLAGLAVAGRAMRPISNLTGAAREIAATRDPSRQIPLPESRDEVAELAQTLDQMLRELDAARGETESMVQTQRDFVADASHELGTPMTSILANLELIQEELDGITDTPAKREVEEMLQSALGSSRRMRRLISDLLQLSRGDAGRLGGDIPLDLKTIVETTIAEIRPVLGDHKLNVHLPENNVPTIGNPDALQGMVMNLLDNARRHTPPDSEITADLKIVHENAILEVSDNGPGIPEQERSQIFSRFVRGGGPADRVRGKGTGLGLAIVDAVAHAHGGWVEISQSPTGGAKFVITIPLTTV